MICVVLLLLTVARVSGKAGFYEWVNPFPFNPSIVIRGIEDFVNFIDKSQLEQKSFKWSEVSHYDGRDGRPLHVVFNDDVYDVTEFVDFHPGGDHHLRHNAGKNVSSVMRAAGMPDYIFTHALKRFRVGKIREERNIEEAEEPYI